MKKSVFLVFLLTFSVASLSAQNDEWIKIKDTVAAYIIEFPSMAKKGEQDVPTEKGSVKMSTYTLRTTNDKNIIYMTSFTKYPDHFFEDGLRSNKKQDQVLDNSVEGAVNNTGGKLVDDTKFMFNGYKGRDVKIELLDTSYDSVYIIQMRTILVGIKLYLTQVIYTKGDEGNKNALRFFESFELINVKN